MVWLPAVCRRVRPRFCNRVTERNSSLILHTREIISRQHYPAPFRALE
jgi:hypothetical protein